MSHLDIPWLQALQPGNNIRLSHTILYPRGQQRRVVSKNKRWLTLDDKTRVSLITGQVIQGRSPHCFYVDPWSEP
jgi:hypothetical protein